MKKIKKEWNRKFVLLRFVKIPNSDKFGSFEDGCSYTNIKDARRVKEQDKKTYSGVYIIERKERMVK